MKRLIIAALCCCLTAAASYAQQNRPDNRPDKDQTKSESCTVTEKGWKVDIKVVEAVDITRERHCETKESAPREPKGKEPKEPKERPGKNN